MHWTIKAEILRIGVGRLRCKWYFPEKTCQIPIVVESMRINASKMTENNNNKKIDAANLHHELNSRKVGCFHTFYPLYCWAYWPWWLTDMDAWQLTLMIFPQNHYTLSSLPVAPLLQRSCTRRFGDAPAQNVLNSYCGKSQTLVIRSWCLAMLFSRVEAFNFYLVG